MDKELGVKVTRLQRRLSVEADGAQSPATPSTPTKKRVTRAKPALELIDENVTENVTKMTTRKSIARDVVEPAEEKAMTPSRRSARIRSNTSLVLETNQNVLESPRARRAIRRNSQLGSDTETMTTPVKPTRRTRKDSTSSVDTLVITNPNENVIALFSEAIVEEPENEISKNSEGDKNDQSPSLRKSPRLNNKKDKKNTDKAVKNINEIRDEKYKTLNEVTQKTDEIFSIDKATAEGESVNNKTDLKLEAKDSEKENLSLTSASLINEIDTNSKKTSVLNKTAPAIEELKTEKTNTNKNKSWTSSNLSAEDGNLNDKNINKDNDLNTSSSGFKDSLLKMNEINEMKSPKRCVNKTDMTLNSSIENKENFHFSKSAAMGVAIETAKLLEKDPSKDMQSVVFLEDSDSNSGSIGPLTIDLQSTNDGEAQHNDGEDQCVPFVKQTISKRSSASESFTVEPMDIDETIPGNVTINDFSDKTNSSKEEEKMAFESSISNEKYNNMDERSNKSKRASTISVQQDSNDSKQKSSLGISDENNESIAGLNKSLSDKSQKKILLSAWIEYGEKFNENAGKSKRKSTPSKVESENDQHMSSVSSQAEKSNKINESVNKSKRKSGSEGESHNIENSSNENKSTLVLSQLKDVSNEINDVSKSHNNTNNDISNVPVEENNEKNKSLNYLTSTPLQKKSLQKIAMQINSSVITPNAESKNTSKVDETTPNKIVSNVTHHNSDSSGEDSRENSNMIDDEAVEAGSNYESGDSRSDEEIRYEEEHEAVDKGETLESEQEFSNDTEYEKDSFVVSSDEEDNDLLSGSGDDLSLSDKELKMSTKSKKKFDERKRKEQKKASKEMYDARHQLNDSDKSTNSKAKKYKRQRLESSVLEKEDEDQPKGKNRQPFDPSQDLSLCNSDADGSIRTRKKKKTKRLTESFSEDNAIPNENEITIFNHSVDKNDPLSLSVKQEPKTPQKKLNISTVLITDKIEEVQVDGNASIMKPNESSDPLQATLAHEEFDSDVSENMEITENYDSILESLNKSNNKQKKAKRLETSLNLNKSKKDKPNETVVDQLNLTQIKKSKKNKAPVDEEREISEEPKTLKKKDVSVVLNRSDEGDTSDSIDMRLLFPEDSNDSDTNAIKFEPDQKPNVEPADKVIQLKRTEAKTDIRESIDEPEDTNVAFFIDTKGTYEHMDTSAQNSAKKNKKRREENLSVNNIQNDIQNEILEIQVSVTGETPINVSLKSEKKKKKYKTLDASQIADNTATEELELNVSAKSDKKKKKNKSQDVSQTDNEAPVNNSFKSEKHDKSNIAASEETLANVSMKSDKKKRKKDKSLDASEMFDRTASETPVNDEEIKSDKKKKKYKSHDAFEIFDDTASETPVNDEEVKSDKKKKKYKSHDAFEMFDNTASETPVNDDEVKSDKKKKKYKSHDAFEMFDNTASETLVDVQVKSDKKWKKKNKSPQIAENTGEDSDEAPMEVAYKSEKNNKSDIADPEDVTLTDTKNKFKKKKKKNKDMAQLQTGVNAENSQQGVAHSKKRKLDMALSTDAADDASFADEIYISNIQKKRKISQTEEPFAEEVFENTSKKRKATHDVQRNTKVFKENSLDKIHVRRLPESVVNQLNDEPPKAKKHMKTKAISTVPFEVEVSKKRKNKPSNYLEQSIYLNDSPVQMKKKAYINNPKVLPFIPTAIISDQGYTSNYRINVLPEETQFLAQASNIANFKNECLANQRIKKLGTFERFKKHRYHKISKF